MSEHDDGGAVLTIDTLTTRNARSIADAITAYLLAGRQVTVNDQPVRAAEVLPCGSLLVTSDESRLQATTHTPGTPIAVWASENEGGLR